VRLHLLNKTGGNFCVLQEIRPVWLQLVSYPVQVREYIYFNYSSLVTTMEDYSGSGLLVNGSSSSCADGSEIPVGTKAFSLSSWWPLHPSSYLRHSSSRHGESRTTVSASSVSALPA